MSIVMTIATSIVELHGLETGVTISKHPCHGVIYCTRPQRYRSLHCREIPDDYQSVGSTFVGPTSFRILASRSLLGWLFKAHFHFGRHPRQQQAALEGKKDSPVRLVRSPRFPSAYRRAASPRKLRRTCLPRPGQTTRRPTSG